MRQRALNLLIPLLIFLLPSIGLSWQTYTWQGKVVGVSDGDTITVLHNGKAEKIRLYGIDCPEKRQSFGKKAKWFTSDLVFGKYVEVKPVTTDKYGRTIAWIYIDGRCLNKELLKAGLAWHYKKYSSDRSLAELENKARLKKIGLWSDPYSIPPWEFRHSSKSKLSVQVPYDKKYYGKTKSLDSHGSSGSADQTIIYHGNIKSHIFHAPGCKYYDCKSCTAIFYSREEAIKQGYRPCRICRP